MVCVCVCVSVCVCIYVCVCVFVCFSFLSSFFFSSFFFFFFFSFFFSFIFSFIFLFLDASLLHHQLYCLPFPPTHVHVLGIKLTSSGGKKRQFVMKKDVIFFCLRLLVAIF